VIKIDGAILRISKTKRQL